MSHKVVKTTERKYYKNWTQPNDMTSNGTLGGNDFAVWASSERSDYMAYRAINGDDWVTSDPTTFPVDYIIYNPTAIKLSNISVRNDDNYFIREYEVYGSNDNNNYVLIYSNTSTASVSELWNMAINSSEFYKYYKIHIINATRTDTQYLPDCTVSIIKFNITAVTEGTSFDYDYYEDVDVYKTIQKTERKYYKNWTQPVLTGNNSNPNFVISANVNEDDAYASFDGIKSNAGWGPKGAVGSFSGLTSWCQMTCNEAINITKVTITNRDPGDNTNQAITSGSWQVSEDGINWVTVNNWINSDTTFGNSWDINLNYSGFYKYNRLCVYSGTTVAPGNWICVGEIELTARTEGTSSDYDFYKDISVCKAIQKNDPE